MYQTKQQKAPEWWNYLSATQTKMSDLYDLFMRISSHYHIQWYTCPIKMIKAYLHVCNNTCSHVWNGVTVWGCLLYFKQQILYMYKFFLLFGLQTIHSDRHNNNLQFVMFVFKLEFRILKILAPTYERVSHYYLHVHHYSTCSDIIIISIFSVEPKCPKIWYWIILTMKS